MSHRGVERIKLVHQAQRPEIIASWLQNMYLWLGFGPKAAKLLIREQGLDSTERLRVITDKNVDDICNVVRKPGGKNPDGMPDREQQVSVIAQENLKLGGDTPLIGKFWEYAMIQGIC